MNILWIAAIVVIVISATIYDIVSYKKFYKRCEINARHPDWRPYCGINFLEKDPKWFIDNGYSEYVNPKNK